MNFASALFSLRRGHKIRRKHWIGYWELGEEGEVYMHRHDGRILNIRESEDILYTLEKMACNDWEIADNDHAANELK